MFLSSLLLFNPERVCLNDTSYIRTCGACHLSRSFLLWSLCHTSNPACQYVRPRYRNKLIWLERKTFPCEEMILTSILCSQNVLPMAAILTKSYRGRINHRLVMNPYNLQAKRISRTVLRLSSKLKGSDALQAYSEFRYQHIRTCISQSVRPVQKSKHR